MNTYALPDQLVQAVVDLLNEMPARASRGVLNALEAECTRQDAERVEAERQRLVAEARRTAPEAPTC